jgi:histidyl-tRNA synthetase
MFLATVLKSPRGTLDVLPAQIKKWQYIESVIRDITSKSGFNEIRFPTFEYTELFSRGVGDTTDVVQKEMYTFEDRGGRSITLRPEGTASTVRLFIQNGLFNEPLPQKLYYIISCFRGERPQAGRLREFHQFGAELFGSACAAADTEVISLAATLLSRLGLKQIRLEINSIGCPECRKSYHEALKKYFNSQKEQLCGTCADRLERNPMRILDCKNDSCKAVAKSAPVVLDYICEECSEHFDEVKSRLEALNISYTINPKIVRGLDYYTRTVFEFIDNEQELTVCGGGRYDGLVSLLGGNETPALGFGMGLERILMLMDSQNCAFPEENNNRIFFATMGRESSLKAAKLTNLLRDEGFAAEYELTDKSLKAQMKYADKLPADYTVVIGDNELALNSARLKNMKTGKQVSVTLDENIVSAFYKVLADDALSEITEAAEKTMGNLQ